MDKNEILLKEYEMCQQHNNALGQQSWVSISILITVNFLVLAQVIPKLVPTSITSHAFGRLVPVLLLGATMIFILYVFWKWFRRITFLQWLNNARMQEIEKQFGYKMWKNWRARGLDLYYSDNEAEKAQLKKLPKLQAMVNHLSLCYPNTKRQKNKEFFKTWYKPPSNKWFSAVFPTLMLLWVLVMILEWLIYCHPIYRWLLN